MRETSPGLADSAGVLAGSSFSIALEGSSVGIGFFGGSGQELSMMEMARAKSAVAIVVFMRI